MKAFHDSRQTEYRRPYGAIARETPVALSLDIWDAPEACVMLRTWIEGEGEKRYDMTAAGEGRDGATRFTTTLTPMASGIVWYQFVIRLPEGPEIRYGARDGAFGGVGRLAEWEPPSFQLTVFDPQEMQFDRKAGEQTAQESHPRASAAKALPAFLAADAGPGSTLDAALRQRFSDALIRYLRGELTAYDLAETMETIREGFPTQAYGRAFDFLGSDDKRETLCALGSVQSLDAMEPWQLGVAKGRLWCASLVQTLLPEPPDGDAGAYSEEAEAWGEIDADCHDIVRNAADLRATLELFADGDLACGAASDNVFFLKRSDANGLAACLLVNRSQSDACDVAVPFATEAASEVIDGYDLRVVDASEAGWLPRAECPGDLPAERYAVAHLRQLGAAVLFFHPERRLQLPLQPGFGVLAHITSLPSENTSVPQAAGTDDAIRQANRAATGQAADTVEAGRRGTLGASARAFVDWLAEAGARYWQVLPVNPTDEHGSPYAGISAFAGNVGLLEEGTPERAVLDGQDDVGLPDLEQEEHAAYRAFCEREAAWLEPYARFMAIRQKQGSGAPWQKWPKRYRSFEPNAGGDGGWLAKRSECWRRAQFAFERQWRDLRRYANERGIRIVGDMPIYVSADSADVWAHPKLFQLGSDGAPEMVAGCPPDPFAEDGQVWGNPVYDWEAMRADGYSWWLLRLKRAFSLYDYVRLDHFIGFARYFSIPREKPALEGAYRPGPGIGFFEAAYEQLGPLPIVAEDLGTITPCVRALSAACGFPGMDIVQFVDGNDPLAGYRPRPEKIAYTGTHDNQTLVGYARTRYPERDARETADELARAVAACAAPTVIMPLQDVMGLGDEARMNVPGTTQGNWSWQARQSEVAASSARLAELVALHEAKRGACGI